LDPQTDTHQLQLLQTMSLFLLLPHLTSPNYKMQLPVTKKPQEPKLILKNPKHWHLGHGTKP
jgi:hypothetical protein